jgi:hypothetical protein
MYLYIYVNACMWVGRSLFVRLVGWWIDDSYCWSDGGMRKFWGMGGAVEIAIVPHTQLQINIK